MRRTLSSIAGLGIAGLIGISQVAKAEDLMENLREVFPASESADYLDAQFSAPSFYVAEPPIEMPGPLYVKAGIIGRNSLPSVEGLKPLVLTVGNDLIKRYEIGGKTIDFVYCAVKPFPGRRQFENTNDWDFKTEPSFYAVRGENGKFQNYRINKEDRNCDIKQREED